MKKNQGITLTKKDLQTVGNGYKVIKSEVTISTENLYAVCTPIRNK
ncbi:hypothetical protein ACERII_17735 [Evansella sp. AB-rgal1]